MTVVHFRWLVLDCTGFEYGRERQVSFVRTDSQGPELDDQVVLWLVAILDQSTKLLASPGAIDQADNAKRNK